MKDRIALGIFSTVALALALTTLACGFGGNNQTQQPDQAVAPITIGDDLTAIDLCQAIPRANIEAVLGRELSSNPQPFSDFAGQPAAGCSYDGGSDSQQAYFGYVVLLPLEAFENQPRNQETQVSGIGDAAYLTNGADARQLWVKIEGKAAFVVAFGDAPNETGAQAIARLLAAAIR